jgi:hypothetical protein
MAKRKRKQKVLAPLVVKDWDSRHLCPRCGRSTGVDTGYCREGCRVADIIDGVSEHEGIPVVPGARSPQGEAMAQAIGMYRKINWR